MTKIAELQDKGAVVAWSPIGEYADVIALGSKEKGGIGFDDYGGELELYDWNITQNNHDGGMPEPTLLGSVKTATRFGSLAWSKGDVSSSILAGGMLDGTVNLYKPSALLGAGGGKVPSDDALLASVQQHKGAAVSALKFNPHADSPNLLATGGSTGQVWMMDIASQTNVVDVYSPNGDENGCNLGGEVTQVAWNSQVSHILASSSANGSVVVWDLRQKKPWCELRVESNCPVSDIAWNPTQGLHMMTASEGGGGLKLWDLRASTSMPLTTLEGGHAGGVLSMDWCPHDDTLLVSCGNDNRTLLWDLYSLQPIAEIPSTDADASTVAQNQQTGGDFYGGGLGSSQQKRYDVSWSPCRRGVISTCSFDRKVQAHSVIGLATKCGRPPKWMSPASGVSCGFGGAVVSISNNNDANSQQQRFVKIDTVVEHPELVAVSETFESEFEEKDCIAYCHDMATRSTDAYESQVWSFMQIMFETNAREELLSYLGFDPEKIHSAAMEFTDNEDGEGGDGSNLPSPPPGGSDDNGDATAATNGASKTPSTTMSKRAENAVQDALLVGNFEAAVECCFRSGNLADALVLASCGGADLWQKTQAQYFAREAKSRPFLSLVSAVIHDRLPDLVATSDPKKWKETLAVLSTYGKSEEFPELCAALGERLEGADVGDFANASLCYMCALNLGQAVKYWKFTLRNANANEESPGGTTTDLLSLHDFIEKVTVFTQALDSSQVELDDEAANLFAEYSKALANQGLLVAASKYLKGCDTQECKELRDRIYRSRMGGFCPDLIASPPDFPYEFVNVGVASDLQGITVKQQGGGQQMMQMQQQQQPEQQFDQGGAATAQTVNQVQQQSQQQPVQQQQVQQSPQLQPTPSEGASPSLLPGWVALQDPTSGQTYYANQITGESSWDIPAAPAPTPQPTATAPSNTYAAQPAAASSQPATVQTQSSYSAANGTNNSTSQKVASKYGDGFVTSASNPQLAEQYGNVGTSNPYTNANRPGTAAAAVGATSKKAPVSGTFDPNSMPALSEEYKYLQDGLIGIVGQLAASASGSMEKKQAAESQRAVAVFIKTLARGGVDAEISHKVGSVVSALQNRDYGSASSIVTGLVSNEWKDHKDWLKGMKFLVQMASKKQL
eukprot:CAMPEP_0201876878 /NCGR_PEP_ID=MMETSP0902-20130614/8436_1 /ASSEMBLY_ACC=CAM_ASM_000551 /TAXON_ID=420261 /ORGANISM="Thalassiosira antarctica, Strain CCMP982" /LENGTH=1129 /DNA_ID=CAMNT_0048404213 /DNA_START=68 /DNA_END=3457 /DNA_ORIENTATION=+